MIERCYLEITNICNLKCAFCPGNRRAKALMDPETFSRLIDQLKGKVRFLYLHLMGEPLMHERLAEYVLTAKEKGLIPIVTTNGTLLKKKGQALLDAVPYKYQISLHSQEGNGVEDMEAYLREVSTFSVEAAAEGSLVILRLWNQGGLERQNRDIVQFLEAFFPLPWSERYDGWKLSEGIYLEYGDKFSWPDLGAQETTGDLFCHALRNQIGVLVDGSVVPCCLDHEGDIRLGNLLEEPLEAILSSDRARRLFDGFTHHQAVESLCKKCGYARQRMSQSVSGQ